MIIATQVSSVSVRVADGKYRVIVHEDGRIDVLEREELPADGDRGVGVRYGKMGSTTCWEV